MRTLPTKAAAVHSGSVTERCCRRAGRLPPFHRFYRKRVHLRAFDDMLMRDPIGKMLEPWEREADEDAGACAPLTG